MKNVINHRLIGKFMLEGNSEGLYPNFLLKVESALRSDQIAEGFEQTQSGLNTCLLTQNGDCTADQMTSGSSAEYLTVLRGEESLGLNLLQLIPGISHPATRHICEEPGFLCSWWPHGHCLGSAVRPPKAILSADWSSAVLSVPA